MVFPSTVSWGYIICLYILDRHIKISFYADLLIIKPWHWTFMQSRHCGPSGEHWLIRKETWTTGTLVIHVPRIGQGLYASINQWMMAIFTLENCMIFLILAFNLALHSPVFVFCEHRFSCVFLFFCEGLGKNTHNSQLIFTSIISWNFLVSWILLDGV